MKKLILLFTVFSFFTSFAQNVDDEKLQFSYIQLPSTPIKGTTNYTVVVDHSKYLKSNEDSLSKFEAAVSLANTQLITWIEQKRKIDQAYLIELGKWEKTINSGVAMAQPVKQPYPTMPILAQEIPEPLMTENISDGLVDAKINLQGFTKGAGGATITLQFDGLLETKIIEKITGAGATTKYEYSVQYRMPVNVKIEVPGQGIILNENINTNVQTAAINKFDSKYDFEYWKQNNLLTFWKTTQSNGLNSILANVDNIINDKCGFPVRQYASEIYIVKKYKDHNYNDLIEAYSNAKSGYSLIYKDKTRQDGFPKLLKAISIWEKALQESNMIDDKSRINDKVTALLYVNIAEAYLWMNDFANSDLNIQKAKVTSAGAGKYKREAEDLERLMVDLKLRKLAND